MAEFTEPTWEQLITDGHVRATRIRRAQPWLVGGAILSMLVGWLFMTNIEGFESQNNREMTLGDEVEKQKLEARRALGGLPSPQITEAAQSKIMLTEGLPDLQAQILAGLQNTDEIPSTANITMIDEEVFWREPWEAGQLVGSSGGSVRIVGGIVNSGTAEFPQIERWLAVFRKRDDEWQSVTIEAPSFVSLPDVPSVSIDTIPLTLAPVLETGD